MIRYVCVWWHGYSALRVSNEDSDVCMAERAKAIKHGHVIVENISLYQSKLYDDDCEHMFLHVSHFQK